MSFLKQLLTPFIEFDKDKEQENPSSPPPTKVAPLKPQQNSGTTVASPVDSSNTPAHHPLIDTAAKTLNSPGQVPVFSPSGTITGPLPEHAEYFEKLIDNANATDPFFQGTDFKEYMDSKVDIDDIQDEAIKYRTAFNVLKSTGLTKEKLLSTAQEYLNVIGRDMNAFQGAHTQKYQKEVGLKEKQLQNKAIELQELTQKINATKAEINQLSQEIDLTKVNLNTIKNSYLLAGENKQKEIQTELQKIAQYF
ncbi:MAG: hypothetical protein V4717_18955 [Bacteroidota bacterium]